MTSDESRELVAGQARLEGKIETLTARLEAHLGRTGDEIRALFASRSEHDDLIAAIRIDYVPKSDFQRFQNENRDEHEAMKTSLSCLTGKVMKAGGAVSLLAFLLGLMVKGLGMVFGHG